LSVLRASDHAISLCYTLARSACPVTLWVGDLTAAEYYVSMLLDHSAKLAMTVWQAEGRCFKGMLLIKRGADDAGCQLLRTALDELRETGSILRDSAFLCALAEGLAGIWQVAAGRAAVDQALERSESSEERWCIAELLRVKGELILLENAPMRQQRPRITSGKPSTGRGGKARCPGNCAPPPASRGCGAAKAGAKKRAHSSGPSTIDLPRGSKPPISKRQRRCSAIHESWIWCPVPRRRRCRSTYFHILTAEPDSEQLAA